MGSSAQRPIVYDCKARLATDTDVPAIIKFYTEHPSPNIVLRKPEEYKRSVANELFLIVENLEGEIIAASGVYLLGDKSPIACEVVSGEEQWGVVAEIGSVRRWNGGLPPDKRYSGLWHPFLFSVPTILLSQRAGVKPAASASNKLDELPIDYLVTSVFTSEIHNVHRLMGQIPLLPPSERKKKRVILAPLHMNLYHPAEGYKKAFLATTDDPNAEKEKFYLKVSVGNLPEVASYLQQCIRIGLINRSGEKLNIDMSDLIERWTIGFDEEQKRVTVLDRIVANADTIAQYDEVGWKEWGRIRGSIAPLPPKPLQVKNGGYHHDDDADIERRVASYSSPLRGLIGEYKPRHAFPKLSLL